MRDTSSPAAFPFLFLTTYDPGGTLASVSSTFPARHHAGTCRDAVGTLLRDAAPDATKDATQPTSSSEGGIVMEFLIDGSEGGPLSQQAMRRLVEVVDGYRGQAQVFVVYRDSFPYQAVSVHTTLTAARQSAQAEPARATSGPSLPGRRRQPSSPSARRSAPRSSHSREPSPRSCCSTPTMSSWIDSR